MTPRCRTPDAHDSVSFEPCVWLAPGAHDSISFGPCVECERLHGAAGLGTKARADVARFAA